MNVKFDCYECILKQIVATSREIGKDEESRKRILREMLSEVMANAEQLTPPEMAMKFHAICTRETGNDDAYREIKIQSTKIGLELLDELRRIVKESEDPLKCAIRLAIAGNIIDYGVNPNFQLSQAKKQILEAVNTPCDDEALTDLTRRIKQAETVFYLLDNCGEAVLDRLVIEQIPGKVTLGVRGEPIYNDVTIREEEESGLTGYPVVTTGCAVPGVSLPLIPDDFRQALEQSNLVISKGQGNYESLENSFTCRPIYFLLRVKCPVISQQLNSPMGAMQIVGKNLNQI